MEAVAGLLVMLFAVSYAHDGVTVIQHERTAGQQNPEARTGVETYCDGRQNGSQCYGALGGTVDIQLVENTSDIYRYQLMKNQYKVFSWKKNNIPIVNMKNRAFFVPSNGTLRINNLSTTDSGEYILQTFNSVGKFSGEQILQLIIQAPVSSVLLVFECLSQGEMKVSCSSEEGDSPQYSWTLDGQTLTDAELFSATEGNNITLKQHVSGHLNCSVRNNVSNAFKEERISTCGFIFINCTSRNGTEISGWVYEANNTLCIEPTTDPTTITQTVSKGNITPYSQTVCSGGPWYINMLPTIGGAILFFVSVAITCGQRKMQHNEPTKQKEKEYDEEVIYTDVRIMQQQGRQAEQREEVEYSQVKFSESAQQSESTGNDCM